jgi:hypothetical protein
VLAGLLEVEMSTYDESVWRCQGSEMVLAWALSAAPALAVLKALPRIGKYVTAGEKAGTKHEKPRADLQRPRAMISARAGLSSVRTHDLRHTMPVSARVPDWGCLSSGSS